MYNSFTQEEKKKFQSIKLSLMIKIIVKYTFSFYFIIPLVSIFLKLVYVDNNSINLELAFWAFTMISLLISYFLKIISKKNNIHYFTMYFMMFLVIFNFGLSSLGLDEYNLVNYYIFNYDFDKILLIQKTSFILMFAIFCTILFFMVFYYLFFGFYKDYFKYLKIKEKLKTTKNLDMLLHYIILKIYKMLIGIFIFLNVFYLVMPLISIFIKLFTDHKFLLLMDFSYFLIMFGIFCFQFFYRKIHFILKSSISFTIMVLINSIFCLNALKLMRAEFYDNLSDKIILINEFPYHVIGGVFISQIILFYLILMLGHIT